MSEHLAIFCLGPRPLLFLDVCLVIPAPDLGRMCDHEAMLAGTSGSESAPAMDKVRLPQWSGHHHVTWNPEELPKHWRSGSQLLHEALETVLVLVLGLTAILLLKQMVVVVQVAVMAVVAAAFLVVALVVIILIVVVVVDRRHVVVVVVVVVAAVTAVVAGIMVVVRQK